MTAPIARHFVRHSKSTRRKLLHLAAAALVAAGVLAASIPAAGDTGAEGDGGIELLDGSDSVVTVDLPEGTPLPDVSVPTVPGALPACADGVDNDGDGQADFPNDPECLTPAGTAEDQPTLPGVTLPAGEQPAGPGGEDREASKRRRARHRKGRGGEPFTGGVRAGPRKRIRPPRIRGRDGRPTTANPTLTLATFGPAPIGVPNFMIDRFRIPPFLLPIYQAAGIQYGIRWEVLAAINEIETDYGRNLNVSTAGAVGWMQFLPSTWKRYGVDANSDGRKDPYNPVDAVFAAARYLRAAGAAKSLKRAIFAYNHADWYVESVLLRARLIAGLPGDLVGSLSGLTQGHFPVAAKARYADDLVEREALRRVKRGANAARIVASSPTRRGINIYARRGSPVVAAGDGVVKRLGNSERLGRYLVMQDAYGNRYTYARLGRIVKVYPVPKERRLTAADFRLIKPRKDASPTGEASDAGAARAPGGAARGSAEVARRAPAAPAGVLPPTSKPKARTPLDAEDARERLYALPARPHNVDRADLSGQLDDVLQTRIPGYTVFRAYFSKVFKFERKTMVMKPLGPGSKIVAGTLLGRIGKTRRGVAPHLHFEIRPAGRGAPRIDPKPILDGWKLLETTAIYRAAGANPFFGPDAKRPSIGQILLMSKEALERRVLADPRLEVYSCGRADIRSGQVDRRVLAALEFLAENGFRPAVTSLKCGHGYYTKTGNVSEHSSGNAVDIAKINGIPILGNQGRGSITEYVLKRLLYLQGTMRPHQVITLMEIGGPTFAMADHADHIHLGFRPLFGPNDRLGRQLARILKPSQWRRLISRLSEIQNPTVRINPSKYAIPVKRAGGRRSSDAHVGE